MPRKTRFHIDALPESSLTPKHLTRQEFGRRLYQLMLSRGWNQSELARRSDLPRDSISTYIRGRTLPTPKSLQGIAEAFGMQPGDILPNAVEAAVDEDNPSLELRVSTSAPASAWLRVNRLVSLATASRVIEVIEADRAAKTSDTK
jgi:transcriptional regulator with XRE-family HTH domain